jgi:transcriptional regulator with XRE-family HTH domain
MELNPSLSVGRTLKEIREKKSIPLHVVAEAIGSSAQYVCDVEHGRKRLTPKVIQLWCKAVGTDPHFVGAHVLSEIQNNFERQSGLKYDFQWAPKSKNRPKEQSR